MARFRRTLPRTRRSGISCSGSNNAFCCALLLLFISTTIAAIVYWLLPSSDTPEDRRGISLFIFISPGFIVPVFFLCWLILENILPIVMILLVIWGPLGTITALWMRLAPRSEDRVTIAYMIMGSPFLLAFAIFGLGMYGMLAWFALILLQNTFYFCLRWRWVFCRPRFRVSDPFAGSQLCGECQNMLSQSGLLFGRWSLLTKAEELYPYNPDKQDSFLPLQPPCLLCVLMMNQFEHLVQMIGFRDVRTEYGHISARIRQPIDREGANAMIRIRTGTWGLSFDRPYDDTDCYFQMLAADGRSSHDFKVRKAARTYSNCAAESSISSTCSGRVITIIKQWLSSCSQHDACMAPADSSFIPTRLVQVGHGSQPECRLVEKSSLADQNFQYFALSHCWGTDVKIVLSAASLDTMKNGIDVNTLSKNFHDAISITRALGMEYVWIDSLCIIQDSPEDWKRESVLMMDVFANATCTLSATASSSSQGGCFRDRLLPSTSCKMVESNHTELRLILEDQRSHKSIKQLFESKVENAPLNRRAWVFQERLLSRRTVHFCSDIVLFECNTIKASETDIPGSTYELAPYITIQGRMYDHSLISKLIDPSLSLQEREVSEEIRQLFASGQYEDHTATRGIRGALDTLISVDTETELTTWERIEFNRRWFELVTPYSERSLTQPTDKLIAISGVAEMISQRSNAQYIAGLWSNVFLEFGLLWYVDGLAERQTTYCAPTWSWAAIEGRVRLWPHVPIENSDITLFSRIQQAVVTLQGEVVERAASHLDGGYLDIQGPVLAVRYSSKEQWKLSYLGDEKLRWSFRADCKAELSSAGAIQELHALFILRYRNTYGSTEVRGLVLRARKGPTASSRVFERVGVFSVSRYPSEAIDEQVAMYGQQTFRIV